jgi:nucleoside phosphorylase/tetratricopeptide (TPR) repeat protein
MGRGGSKPSATRETDLQQRATIGILTALPKELAAVQAMLEDSIRWTAEGRGAGRQYRLGEIPSASGPAHVVAVALLPDMGNNPATLAANNLLHHFPAVEHVIMCGIAGGVPRPGVPDHDVRLGDIVVSNRNGVVQYDLTKEGPDGTKEHRHPPRPPGAALLEAVRHLQSEELLGKQPWVEWLSRGDRIKHAHRPDDHVNAKGEAISYPPDPERQPGRPRVFAGTIAAANNLLKNATYRDYLGATFDVKAVEMEGSGVADAAWASDHAGYLVVRGICDYCDGQKGDLWQGYAAVAAAAYVRALIEWMTPSAEHSPPPPRVRRSKRVSPSTPSKQGRRRTSEQPDGAEALNAGDDHPALPPLVMGSIPTDISVFTGRATVLRGMKEFYERTGSGVCVLFGLGGCGKSATLKKFADTAQLLQPRASRRRASVLSWSFAQDDSLDRFFVTLARYLDSLFLPEDRMSGPTPDSTPLALPDKISRCNRRIVLLLDGVERIVADTSRSVPPSVAGGLSAPSMRALLQRAAENDCGQLRIFLTTRVPIPDLTTQSVGVESYDLNRMPSDDAVQLLSACGVRGATGHLESAAAHYHYHAYSLFLLGKALAAAFDGDVRRRDRIESRSDAIDSPMGTLLKWYESYLGAGDIAILRVMALFRGDVSLKTVVGLMASEPDHAKGHRARTARDVFRAVNRLLRNGLAFSLETNIGPGSSCSLHPIVREFYYHQLVDPVNLHERALAILAAELPEEPPRDAKAIGKLVELIYHSIKAGQTAAAWRIYRDRMGGYPHIGYSLADHPTGAKAVYLFIDEGQIDGTLPTKDLFDLYVDGSLYLKNEGRLEDAEELLSMAEVGLASKSCDDDRFVSMLLVRSGIQLVRGHSRASLATIQRAETTFNQYENIGDEKASRRVRKEVLSRRAAALAVRGDVEASAVFERAAAIPDSPGVLPHDYLPIRYAWYQTRVSQYDDARAIVDAATGPLEDLGAAMLSQRLFVIAALNELHAGIPSAAQQWIDRLTAWSTKADIQMFILSWLVQATRSLVFGKWEEARELARRGARHAADNGFILEFYDLQWVASEACSNLGDWEGTIACAEAVLNGSHSEYLFTVRPATDDEVRYFWAYSSACRHLIDASRSIGRSVDEKLVLLDAECRRQRETLEVLARADSDARRSDAT